MKICVIDCTEDKFLTRGLTRKTSSSAYSIGIKCVEEEILTKIGGKALPRVDVQSIRFFDVALLSLTSLQEIESYIVAIKRLPAFRLSNCKVIAGGFGCINITSIYDYIDVAVFGRCDHQINQVIAGNQFSNVWRKEDDSHLQKKYTIGNFVEPKSRLETGNIGCRMNCAYCQYTHVRLPDQKPYVPKRGASETDLWASNFTRPGVYTTAIDGLTEETRMKVSKPITDEFFWEKMQEVYSPYNKDKHITIQLYNIIGYPWETEKSVIDDMTNLVERFKKLDKRTGKHTIKIVFKNTPFEPMPLTPMESVKCNWDIDFRKILKIGYKGIDLTIKQWPFLRSPETRKRGIIINRCTLETRDSVQKYLLDSTQFNIPHQLLETEEEPAPYLIRPKTLHKERFNNVLQ